MIEATRGDSNGKVSTNFGRKFSRLFQTLPIEIIPQTQDAVYAHCRAMNTNYFCCCKTEKHLFTLLRHLDGTYQYHPE